MHPPSLAEHGAEREGEPAHQEPRSRRADVRERVDARQLRVEPEEDDAAVGEGAPDYDEVVQVRRRHLDVPARERVGGNTVNDGRLSTPLPSPRARFLRGIIDAVRR